ncbi:3613_t:CDS:2, partial [Ambispora gerdemannii]
QSLLTATFLSLLRSMSVMRDDYAKGIKDYFESLNFVLQNEKTLVDEILTKQTADAIKSRISDLLSTSSAKRERSKDVELEGIEENEDGRSGRYTEHKHTAKKRREEHTASILVLNSKRFRSFPVNDKSDFLQLRTDPELAYFDRTRYISDLSVHRDVLAGKVIPNQFFDFFRVSCDSDPKVAKGEFHEMINNAIRKFYRTYASIWARHKQSHLVAAIAYAKNSLFSQIYLLADEYDSFSNAYLNLKDQKTYSNLHNGQSLLKIFWACVQGPPKDREISEDVLAALQLFNVCGSDVEVQQHFHIMVPHYSGCRFSQFTGVPRVFNTNTTLDYLQVFASSPIAVSILEKVSSLSSTSNVDIWHDPILYKMLPFQFRFSDLVHNIMISGLHKGRSGLMRYAGGLTYVEEEHRKQLRISNLIQVQRFTLAVLARYQLCAEDVEDALMKIVTTGNVTQLLAAIRS